MSETILDRIIERKRAEIHAGQQHYTIGDFEAMAARLLLGEPATNARRVRMRFNQLGLSARALRHDVADGIE